MKKAVLVHILGGALFATSVHLNAQESLQLHLDTHTGNVLMADVEVQASTEMEVVVEITQVGGAARQTNRFLVQGMRNFTLPGFKAETAYVLQAKATLSSGQEIRSEALNFTTSALPFDIPDINVTVNTPDVDTGITLFATSNSGMPVLLGIDQQGEVVWYQDSLPLGNTSFVRRNRAGRLLLSVPGRVITLGLDGEVFRELEMPGYHHDIVRISGGHFLLLTNENVEVDGKLLNADIIVEVDGQGSEVWRWRSVEHLDTARFPGPLSMRETRGALDWTHANSLYYNADNDSILMSARSQSWVVNLSRQTGDIRWILGSEASSSADFNAPFFALTQGAWQTAQHAATLTRNGDVLLYDNRNESGGEELNSRAVRFSINEATLSATQTWEYVAPKYTGSFGDVDELTNGNVLVVSGGPGGNNYAYITQASSVSSNTPVWQLSIEGATYRAERVSWEDMLIVN